VLYLWQSGFTEMRGERRMTREGAVIISESMEDDLGV